MTDRGDQRAAMDDWTEDELQDARPVCATCKAVRTLINPAAAMAVSLYGERWFRETDIRDALDESRT